MFMNIVFSQEQFDKLKEQLSQTERDMLPTGFTEIVILGLAKMLSSC
jgi:hypothetical protein